MDSLLILQFKQLNGDANVNHATLDSSIQRLESNNNKK